MSSIDISSALNSQL